MSVATQMAALGTAQSKSPIQAPGQAKGPVPPIPERIADTGLPESMVEQLILKTLYFQGDTLGRDLSGAVGLKFSVIEGLIELSAPTSRSSEEVPRNGQHLRCILPY